MKAVIIGNGIAGVTAARTLRKLDRKVEITMISKESTHHWSRPALMYLYMGHMRLADTKPYEDRFWKDNRIALVHDEVVAIEPDARALSLRSGRKLAYDRLLLALGSVPNRFGWPGQDLKRVGGMYSLQDLERLEAATPAIRRGVVVGGGLIGVELAEMLHSRGAAATMLVREDGYWRNVLPPEESAIVGDVIREAGIDLRLHAELETIIDDGSGAAGGVRTTAGQTIEAQFVGLCAGVRPNIGWLEGGPIDTGRGVRVDATLQTSVKDIWAAGDCAEIAAPGEAQGRVQAVWYTGRAHGEVAAANMLGAGKAYRPGVWFNSAKFFDLEYQVYGTVPNNFPEDGALQSLYWAHPSRRRALRLVHSAGRFVGLSALGIRYRHRLCEAWIESHRPIREVVAELEALNFDPELFRRDEASMRAAFAEQGR